MTPVIFIGTSDFSVKCLEYLLESEYFKIQAIVTVPDRQRGRGMKWQNSAVKVFSEKLNKPIFTPEKLSEESFLKEISKIRSHFAIVCAYGKILPKTFLKLFPKQSVNIHPSLLPLWRGAAPIERCLMNGDNETGVSLQCIGERLDAGDIIGKVSFPIEEDETAKEVYKKAEKASKKLLQEDLVSYLKGELNPQAQLEEQACYAHKIEKKEAEIDWSESALKIHNKVRALVLDLQAFTFFNGQRLKIYKTKVLDISFLQKEKALDKSLSLISAGEVVVLDKSQLVLSCGTLALSLLEVQREGRKKQKIEEFLKGVSIKLGDTLGVKGD